MAGGRIALDSTVEALTGHGGITYTARTEVDAEALADLIRGSVQAATKQALQTLANMVVSVTAPNNPTTYLQRARTPGSYRPNKAQVNKLKRRIMQQLMGSGKPANAIPNAYGRPVLAGPRGVEGSTPLPIVTVRPHRGRPAKGRKLNKPDRVLGADELMTWLDRNTELWTRHDRVERVAKAGASWVWTTGSAWRQVAKRESMRAGNFVHGWAALAQLAGGRAVANSTLPGGRYDSPGTAWSTTSIEAWGVDAVNESAPVPTNRRTANLALKTQGVIDSMLATGWDKALDKALRRNVKLGILRRMAADRGIQGATIDWA